MIPDADRLVEIPALANLDARLAVVQREVRYGVNRATGEDLFETLRELRGDLAALAAAGRSDGGEPVAVRDVAEAMERLVATMKLWSERLAGALITEMNAAHPGKKIGTMIAAALA